MHTFGRVTKAVGAWLLLLALLAVLPALCLKAGWPLPHSVPTVHQLSGALRRPLPEGFTPRLLAVVGWAIWARAVLSILIEVKLRVRHGERRHGLQTWVGKLVATAVLLAGPAATTVNANAAPRLAPATAVVATVRAAPAGRGSTAVVAGQARASATNAVTADVGAAPTTMAPAHRSAAASPTARNGTAPAAQYTPTHQGEYTVWPGYPAPTAPVPSEIPAGTKYVTVAPGSTLWSLGENHMGDGMRAEQIWTLNAGRIMPGGEEFDNAWLIKPGWTLIMPADATGCQIMGPTAATTAPAPAAAPQPPVPVAPNAAAAQAASGTAAHTPATTPSTAATTPVTAAAPAAGSLAATAPASTTATSAPARTATTTPHTAAAPAVAPGADQAATNPTRTSRAAARHSGVVPLPVELLGAGILAAGLVALIRRRTDAQRARRRFGRRIPRPSGEQARVELAARIGADEAGAEFIDVGLRYLARGLRATASATPDILGAELHADRLVVLLAEAGHTPPPGFEPGDDEMSWTLPRFDDDEALADLEELVDDIIAPLPTMVTIGRSGDDGEITVMMNPESVGIISIAGDIVAARQVVASIAVELATATWSQLARVYMIGFGRADGLGDTDPTILAATVEECLPALRAEAAERRAHAHDPKTSAAELRIHGEGADLGPSLVLCVTVPDRHTLAELDELASDPTCGVGAVIAGDVGDAVTRGWALELDDQDLIEVGPLGRHVAPQFVSYRILEAIEGRIAVATDPDDVAAGEPAEHWYPPEADSGDPVDLHPADVADVDLGDGREIEGQEDEENLDDDVKHAGAERGRPAAPTAACNGTADRGAHRGDPTGPSDDQAEESVLGAMLLSRDAVTVAIASCDAGQFSKAAHRHIFDAICTLVDRGELADPATVADELRRAGHFDEGRGLAMLVGLQTDAAVERALRELATLPVPIPEHMRHPQVLAQALRPKPRVVRVATGGLAEITWGKPNRTRSLEAVMYKSFYPDCSNKQLATILSAGQRPQPGDNGGYNAKTFRTTMVVARTALGTDPTGHDLLSTKADGDGRYVLLKGLVLDWNIFKLLVNAASADRSDDVDDDTRIRLLSTALDLVGAGGPFSGVSLGSTDTFWKWIEVGPSNLRGEMEAHILDAAHWLAELCLERHDFEGVRQAVEKGRSITTLDLSLNCNLLDMELSVHGPAALEAAFARVDADYRGNAGAEETDDPVAPEVREHYRDLKIAAGG